VIAVLASYAALQGRSGSFGAFAGGRRVTFIVRLVVLPLFGLNVSLSVRASFFLLASVLRAALLSASLNVTGPARFARFLVVLNSGLSFGLFAAALIRARADPAGAAVNVPACVT
jgi:hypothetical protein